MYVNGYLLSVPEDKKDAYVAIVNVFVEVAKEYGALEIFENWELEVPDGEQTDYRKAVQAKPGEKIVFSWVVWPDRRAGAVAHEHMWEDPRWDNLGESPVDAKRMVMGGFEPIVAYRKE
ncbi:MAG: DUF1428 family protein [Pseudomonadales bacterium]|nr:DUF1428 family protein [Pseudomonadales bacterium]